MIDFHEFGGHTVGELISFFNQNGYKIDFSYSETKRKIIHGFLHAGRKIRSIRLFRY